MLTSYRLELPALNFGDDGVPRSSTFDDVYFDKDAGLEETRYVFLQHNHLASRWQPLQKHQCFTIAETGFGTGLNFLCAWQQFLESSNEGWLHFVSVEKFPLDKDKLAQSLVMWPSLSHLAELLCERYPTLCHGLHMVEFPEYRTTLTLWFGEASAGFQALNGCVDAWFLDGFAPSKNPEMWSEELFQNIQRLSHTGTTFATFTAAGIVRRGLKSHGFDVQKVKGFGHKREMMVGTFVSEQESYSALGKPWFNVRHSTPLSKVLVIGSGIAGATTASALAHKDIEVDVWEQDCEIANGGSGNEQGMLYPKLSASDKPLNRFYLSAYLFAQRFYQQQKTIEPAWQQCGLLQLPKDATEHVKFEKILADKLYPESVLANHPEGLHLPLSGWVRPKVMCEHLLTHHKITVSLNKPLIKLERTQNGFIASNEEEQTHYSHVVFCTANHLAGLSDWQTWPTKPIRGQVTQLPTHALADNDRTKARQLQHVLCADGYVSPELDNHLNFGATYDLGSENTEVSAQSHQENLQKLQALLSIDTQNVPLEACSGRVGMRCTVTDYTPIVGPVSSHQSLIERYAPLRKNAKWQTDAKSEAITGLYINTGHGSRGLVSAPLSAQYISSLIFDEMAPLEQSIIEALHPNRFSIRQLKRGEA
ncbi:bifunctional tRNA (5-methylaminomethyl-2-thiouridine)(34)-methyltransferase MnmD/FAD-dependent 5-carboxymethylaminomethyl-2-thiouridine(34) oxidoreductase MnmC [Marinomonas gallaica]|uniref:bifunctional tRNA (5-methylaminomethyl-2-thiouridine)(34)-methyltransferase MnmD/FAD-dependent 5-carboxymethylaminomethyl-2-thiouridine(34) oxidoreductase MnmC n=1 Tax=Marinomonas gallaica TaxID=1806667 RepID=UPI003A92A964